MSTSMSITLGNTYRDAVHGIVGIAVSRCSHLTGCDQVNLQRLDKDGEVKDYWVDITRLEDVELTPEEARSGGPQRTPSSSYSRP